jgi:uncharacterized protein
MHILKGEYKLSATSAIPAITILFLLGLFGGFVFKILKLPAPLLLGPLVAVSLGNLAGLSFPLLPTWFDNSAQTILGFYLGSSITRDNLHEIKAVSLPAAAIAVWSLVITFLLGYFVFRTTVLSLPTAILSASPGGAPEVSILALSVNADVTTVTVIQMARLFAVLLLTPLFSKMFHTGSKSLTKRTTAKPVYTLSVESAAPVTNHNNNFRSFIEKLFNPGLGIAVLGGFLFYTLQVPAGFMVGAMIAVGISSVSGLKIKPLPDLVRTAAYIGIGVLIGQYFTREALMNIVEIYPIVLIVTGLMLLSCAALAVIISKTMGWRLSTCLLATAPGGLITLTAIAAEMDSDPLKVSLLHMARLITIKLTLPLVIILIK